MTNDQLNPNSINPKQKYDLEERMVRLEFGIWGLVGNWDLDIGILK